MKNVLTKAIVLGGLITIVGFGLWSKPNNTNELLSETPTTDIAKINPESSTGADIPKNCIGNDLELDKQFSEWQNQLKASVLQRANALAALGGADNLLAATALSSNEDTAKQRDEWFNAARNATPASKLVAWIDASVCSIGDPENNCSMEPTLNRLLTLDNKNSMIYILGVSHAFVKKDEQQLISFLNKAANAPDYNSYELDISRLIFNAIKDITLPPQSSALAKANFCGTTISGEKLGKLTLLNVAKQFLSLQPPPPFEPLMQICLANKQVMPAEIINDCKKIMQKMAADSVSLTSSTIGTLGMIQLSENNPEEFKQWRENYRQFFWLIEKSIPLVPQPTSANFSDYPEFMNKLLTQGEQTALRWLLDKNNIPQKPNADWLPQNEEQRKIILGQMPTKEEEPELIQKK